MNRTDLQKCSTQPMTGYTRNGYCDENLYDSGKHLVCAEMTKGFLDYTESQNNPLRSVVQEGEKWCLCEDRYKEAYDSGYAPNVVQNSTHLNVKSEIQNRIRTQKGGRKKFKKTTKKQFLYNPDDPKKSFDVYIDKNPNDTIPIKYSTVKEVRDTIIHLRTFKMGQNNLIL